MGAKVYSGGHNQSLVYFDNGTVMLVSYETPVAATIPNKGAFRTEKNFSLMTERHIKEWLGGQKFQFRPQSFLLNLHNL